MDILLVTVLGVLIIMWFVCWIVHVSTNKDCGNPYGWGSYSKFINQFYKYPYWEYDKSWKTSLFGKDHDRSYYIHADIIRFDGKCMILAPISYIRFRFFMWKTCRNIRKVDNKQHKVIW